MGAIDFQDGFYGHTAGDFPCCVSAHTIGDNEQMPRSLTGDRVFRVGNDERIPGYWNDTTQHH